METDNKTSAELGPLRVILVMIEPPLPFGNAAARWYYVLLKGLVERGHQVTALAACSKRAEIEESRQLFPAADYDLRLFATPTRRGLKNKLATLRRPYSYMFSDAMKRDIAAELARGFDVLHLEQLSSGWLGLDHADKAVVNVHFLYSIDLAAAEVTRVEEWLMSRAERLLLRSYSRFSTLSERLAETVREANPRAAVAVVPLGIDVSLYPYIPDDRRTTEPVVCVIGSMSWYPSCSAAVRLLTRLWPAIQARVPGARAKVVGWGARAALREFLEMPDVTIEENVPDIRPYFERTGVMLYAPARGSGMKVKVLEALGFGVPVVTTSEGVEGLPAVDGVHAGVCDDDAGLIERAVALLTEPDRRNRQRAAGRALLEAHCGPKPTLDAIERIYARIKAERQDA
jgi:glycosyltransferase involved in cell wall biosynthesis